MRVWRVDSVRGVLCVLGSIATLGACMTQTAATPSADRSGTAVVRYVALGDSYTIGTSIPGSDAWPNQLVAAANGKVPLELVANLGVNGYSTGDLIRGELPQLPDLRPDFVTLLIGVNDVVRDVSADQYRANLDQIFGAVLAVVPRERIVVVSTPDYTRTPRGADFGTIDQQRAAIADFNSIMKAAADVRGAAFVDISSVADQASTDSTLVAGDQLHPSAVQYRRWVELIAPVVEGLFAN